jgi:molybdopterin-synthase adenylyltransferase
MSSRYHRQEILPQIGIQGQRRISDARVLLIGCGALGTVMAEMLARAGIGHLRIMDRDIVELTNLQRQTLFTESDARNGLPKAIAAAERLGLINSEIVIEPMAVDVDSGNVESLLTFPNSQLSDLILDGTDNVETRYLINDVAVMRNIPWVYAAAVGTEGRVMGVMPGVTPCLRCMFPTPPAGAELATCDTSGVLAAATSTIASLAVVEGFKLLLGERPSYLLSADVWSGRFAQVDTSQRDEQCVCCGKRKFEFLDRPAAGDGAKLCGRNAVQIRGGGAVDLQAIGLRWAQLAEIQQTPHMVRATLRDPAGMVLSVFPDGRVIVTGTSDVGRARSLAARFLGA